MTTGPVLLSSITDADDTHRGCVVVSGSHGGLYPGYLAARAGLAAVIFNDAGIGLEDAGIAGVLALSGVGMAAAAVGNETARIGDAGDMMARGRISRANAVAAALGVAPGMPCIEAAGLLADAPAWNGVFPTVAEARRDVELNGGVTLVLADSASLVRPDDRGRIVVTGSHGGLIGGDPARACKAEAALAVFNDAGVGADAAGIGRLPALDAKGVPAVTVAHSSARIGDAVSAWETGRISHANRPAAARGAVPGDGLKAWALAAFARA
jgi:hypothetical protein